MPPEPCAPSQRTSTCRGRRACGPRRWDGRRPLFLLLPCRRASATGSISWRMASTSGCLSVTSASAGDLLTWIITRAAGGRTTLDSVAPTRRLRLDRGGGPGASAARARRAHWSCLRPSRRPRRTPASPPPRRREAGRCIGLSSCGCRRGALTELHPGGHPRHQQRFGHRSPCAYRLLIRSSMLTPVKGGESDHPCTKPAEGRPC